MKITKPLAFFDIESTGILIGIDRIVSIAVTLYRPNEKPLHSYTLVNPEMPIPAEATEVHKITNEMVKDAPTFLQISASLLKILDRADLAGYNSNKFDIPFLIEEFLRVGIDFDLSGRSLIDAFVIFKKQEPRDLTAALKFYCGKVLENSHDARADTKATSEVLRAQLEYYPEFAGNSIEEIAEFCKDEKQSGIDYAGKLSKDAEGDYIYTFGTKTKNVKVKNDASFGKWMLKQDFITRQTKKVLQEIFTELGIK